MHEEIQELINEIRTPEEIIAESNPREELEELIRGMDFVELFIVREMLEETKENGACTKSVRHWKQYQKSKKQGEL